MPIGNTVVYNKGDLILATVSSSGNTYQENKIAAATSSVILFDNNGLINSQSLNTLTVGTASYLISSSSSSLTASYLTPTNNYSVNFLTASALMTTNGPVMISGSNAYLELFPLISGSIPVNTTASYIYTSGSTNDLYFTQYNGPYTNTTRLRWLEGNMYTGLLDGGLVSATIGSTIYNISSGSGIIVRSEEHTSELQSH